MKISAIIMASGLSRRMGENKLLLDFKGDKLYEWTFDLVEEIDFDDVILVSSYDEILDDAKKEDLRRFSTTTTKLENLHQLSLEF